MSQYTVGFEIHISTGKKNSKAEQKVKSHILKNRTMLQKHCSLLFIVQKEVCMFCL